MLWVLVVGGLYLGWRFVCLQERKHAPVFTWEDAIPFFMAAAYEKGYTRDECLEASLEAGAILPKTVCMTFDALPDKGAK